MKKRADAGRQTLGLLICTTLSLAAACGYTSSGSSFEVRPCNGIDECEAEECCMAAPLEDYVGICWPRENFPGGECPAPNPCGGVTNLEHDPGEACLGTGACGAGVYECGNAEALRCSTDPGGSQYAGTEETCNGVDDDCNGLPDDIDGDGDTFYASYCGGDDCNDADPGINRWIPEVCGDGIDQDCSGRDLGCDARFTQVAEELGFSDDQSGRGVAFVDFDGDGDLDVFVAGNGQDLLYRNDGGHFMRVEQLMGMVEESAGRGIAAGDYDNDGDLDFFVANYAGDMPFRDPQDFLWRNDGDVFTRADAEAGLQDASNGSGPALADYDNDGWLDLYVANYLEDQDFLYHNEGGTFTRVDEAMGIVDDSAGSGALFTDYDDDGDLDLYVANYFDEQDFLYRNDGDRFTRVDQSLGIVDGSGGRGIDSADYDNDGDLDFFAANYEDQQDFLYRNDGVGFTRADSLMGIFESSNSMTALFFDFDNDADQDLFVVNYYMDQPDFLYRNDGDLFTRVEVILGLVDRIPTVGAACGDVDGDGDLDLYVSNFNGRSDYLWRNDFITNNRWLEVRALIDLGGGKRRDAMGAMVWVDLDGDGDFLPASEGGGGMVMMELHGGSNQSQLALHFGLGEIEGPVAVKARFPGPGTLEQRTVITTGVTVDRLIEMIH